MDETLRLTPDFLLRVAVCSAIAAATLVLSGRLGRRFLGSWYSPNEENLHIGVVVGLLSGLGIARDYADAAILIALVAVGRFLYKLREVRIRRKVQGQDERTPSKTTDSLG